MTIKSGIVSPFAHISTSSRGISVVEQRQYLYNQERQLEKAVRYQEGVYESIQNLVNFREKQIHAIINYQNNQQSDYVGVLEDISGGINTLGFKIDQGTKTISIGLKEINITQLLGLQQLGKIDQTLQDGFDNMLKSLEQQTTILIRISSQIGKIIETLQNPRKIEGLEYKRDAINYIQKKWFTEAIEYLHLASAKLTSDQDVYYFIGIIEFEENKNYEVAIENFEKSIKYAKGYGDMQIYSQALAKLASIYFIQDGINRVKNISKIQKAFDYQLDAVVSSNQNSSYIFDLLKYSVLLSKYDTFAEYLYIFLKNNPLTIADIASYSLFLEDKKVIKIINTVIAKIAKEDQTEKNKLGKEKAEKLGKEEYKKKLGELRNKFYLLSGTIDIQEQKEIQGAAIEWKNLSKPELNEYGIGVCEEYRKSAPCKYLVNKFGKKTGPYQSIQLLNNGFAIGHLGGLQGYFLINQALEIVVHGFNIHYYSNGVIKVQENSTSNYIILKNGINIRVPSGFNSNSFITAFDYRKGYALMTTYKLDNTGNHRIGWEIYNIYKDGKSSFMINGSGHLNTDNYKITNYFEDSIELNLNENKYYISYTGNGSRCLHEKISGTILSEGSFDTIKKYLIQHGDLISEPISKLYYTDLSSVRNKINFIGPDGEYTFKSSNHKGLLVLYKERDSLIGKYLIGNFNENGKGNIKLLNEIYEITRNKNKFGGFDYRISF